MVRILTSSRYLVIIPIFGLAIVVAAFLFLVVMV